MYPPDRYDLGILEVGEGDAFIDLDEEGRLISLVVTRATSDSYLLELYWYDSNTGGSEEHKVTSWMQPASWERCEEIGVPSSA
tara:strand:- start:327 stop:575 length:249 start_codon:yes stop_codon:yes gene_type:complete